MGTENRAAAFSERPSSVQRILSAWRAMGRCGLRCVLLLSLVLVVLHLRECSGARAESQKVGKQPILKPTTTTKKPTPAKKTTPPKKTTTKRPLTTVANKISSSTTKIPTTTMTTAGPTTIGASTPSTAAPTLPCLPSVSKSSTVQGQLCSGALIFEDNFDTIDPLKWTNEVTMAGGGNNEFQVYWDANTAPANSSPSTFVANGALNIKPYFLASTYSEEFLSSGTINLGKYCTASWNNGCVRTGADPLILPPITSARVHTVNTFTFMYGRVEVRAQLPAGDWIWPAVWMMPKKSAYGYWPRSGEIDIMESRGNRELGSFNGGWNIGTELSSSTLHWGPDPGNNRFRKTNWERRTSKGQGYDLAFHLYQVEWTPDYIKFSIDGNETGRVSPMAGGFWELGNFSSSLTNLWANGTKMAPFDQEFFLILNVAVGGTSGFFPDGISNPKPKPWSNTSPNTAFKDFWTKRSDWEPTWKTDGSTALKIDYVKVWAL